MYLKSFFIQKYPLLIWLCIHFLQPSLKGQKRPGPEAGEDATSSGLHHSYLWPLLPCLYFREVGGEWSYIFLFSPVLTFISWPSFDSIFHNWLYSPVAKTLALSLRSLSQSHGSNPGQDKILKIWFFLALGVQLEQKLYELTFSFINISSVEYMSHKNPLNSYSELIVKTLNNRTCVVG